MIPVGTLTIRYVVVWGDPQAVAEGLKNTVNTIVTPFGYLVDNASTTHTQATWGLITVTLGEWNAIVYKTESPAFPLGVVATLGVTAITLGTVAILAYWFGFERGYQAGVEEVTEQVAQTTQELQEAIEEGVEEGTIDPDVASDLQQLISEISEPTEEGETYPNFGQIIQIMPPVIMMILLLTLMAYIPRPPRRREE